MTCAYEGYEKMFSYSLWILQVVSLSEISNLEIFGLNQFCAKQVKIGDEYIFQK